MKKRILASVLSMLMLLTAVSFAGAAGAAEKPFEGVTLTWWVKLHENLTGVAENLGDTMWYKALHDATGITIEFIHPAAGQEDVEFSLLIAGGEYPDIIEHKWTSYDGGATAAIEDGVIIALNDYVAGGQTPNLKAILDESSDIDKSIKTSAGDYYVFPFLRGTTYEDNNCLFTSGYFMRGDILDELSLDVPETIDEWYTVLSAVHAAYPDMVPFVTRTAWMNELWSPGFDNYWDYYVEDGVVKNGIGEASRYDYLQTMAQWYKEGLIDQDYLTHTKSADGRSVMAAGTAFATYDACGGGGSAIVPPLLEAGIITDESDIVTTVPVTSAKGENAKFSKMNGLFDASGGSAAITTQCKNIDAAIWLLDYMYSEEGHMINCFGIEGESYNMVDGFPQFTDVVLQNPDGLSVAQALSIYARGHQSGPVVQDTRVNLQYYSLTSQVDGMTLWTRTDFGEYMYPAGAAIAIDNSEDFATITNNIKTYREEMEAKWITGQTELTEASFQSYLDQLEAYGLRRAIQYKQDAYDTFMAQ